VRTPDPRSWSLARQLVVLQVCIVVLTIGIEAMVSVYGEPVGSRQLLGLIALSEVSLTLGIAASLLLAGWVRRQTLNLEPAVIARLYQHHHAMLHAVSEGLLITDDEGRLVLANDEARRLLRLPADAEGSSLAALLTDAGLANWAGDETPARDQLQVAAGRVLLVSRSTAEVDGVPVGTVTTLRDRTELQQALHELDDIRALAAALREQSHESANRLQALVGLVELGRYEEAVRLGTRDAAAAQRVSDEMVGQAVDPALAALLLGKTALADQHGVELRVRVEGTITAPRLSAEDVVTIVGNLIDNALDAAITRSGGRIDLALETGEDGTLDITVRDNGPGIAPDHLDSVFTPGWTTKPSERPGGRGLGLALVRHTVTRLGGTITVRNDDGGGAEFRASLPATGEPASASAKEAAANDHDPRR
jgi:two-component system CitB family sensor kinase